MIKHHPSRCDNVGWGNTQKTLTFVRGMSWGGGGLLLRRSRSCFLGRHVDCWVRMNGRVDGLSDEMLED